MRLMRPIKDSSGWKAVFQGTQTISFQNVNNHYRWQPRGVRASMRTASNILPHLMCGTWVTCMSTFNII